MGSAYSYDGTLKIVNKSYDHVTLELLKMDNGGSVVVSGRQYRLVDGPVKLKQTSCVLNFEEKASDIDLERDYPLRDILEKYSVRVTFEDGKQTMYHVIYGYNGGSFIEGIFVYTFCFII